MAIAGNRRRPYGAFFSQKTRDIPAPILRRAQLDHLTRQAPMMALVSSAVVIVVLLLLGDRTSPVLGALWGAAIIIPSLLNLVRSVNYRRKLDEKAPVSRRAIQRAVLWSLYMGIMWGLSEFLFYKATDSIAHIVLAFVTVGMAAGMVATLAPLPGHVLSFCVGAVPPGILCMMTRGTPEELAVGALLVVFLAALGFATMTGFNQFREMLVVKQTLRSAMHHLEDAIENTGEALAIFDREGELVLANALYRDFFPNGICAGCDQDDPCIQQLADGRWVRTTSRRTLGGGRVAVHADITELKRQEIELKAARAEAESASQAKSQFLAVMSHELRTPLNSIIGFAELIERSDIPTPVAKMRDYARYVLQSGRHLLGIISDILDLSRIEAKRYDLREESVCLEGLVADMVGQLAPQAKEAGVIIETSLQKLPDFWGETRAMRQILYNLLSNAIKFTEKGGRIRVEAHRDDEGLVLSVSDTGIGIPADQQEQVFEPFRQVDNALARQHQGTGLGLPLVRKLAELHGGGATLQSESGKGTTVSIRLPIERLQSAERPKAAAQ